MSVILVSYNTADLLGEALVALAPEGHEVIVVDNASRDGSADRVAAQFPWVKLIRNEFNVGFGAANNQGLAAMTGDLALLLNSDAKPHAGAISQLASHFSDPGVVGAGGRLEFPDGRLQNSCCSRLTLWAVFCEQFLLEKAFPRSPLFSPYWLTSRLPQDRPSEVAQVMGACLMFRPLEKFDERFFLYTEDTELCHRLAKHGKFLYDPQARFTHALGASSEGTRWQSVARYNLGKELYFGIHSSSFARVACLLLNRAGALLRLILWLIPTILTLGQVKKFAKQTGLWFKVLGVGFGGPPLPPDSRP